MGPIDGEASDEKFQAKEQQVLAQSMELTEQGIELHKEVVLITLNIFLVGSVNIVAWLLSLALVPLHWWYFWKSSTLTFY
jgi:hypothetical protein